MPLPLLAAIPAIAAISAKTTAVIGAVAAAVGTSKTLGTSATVASIAASKIPVPPVPPPVPDTFTLLRALTLVLKEEKQHNSQKVKPCVGSILFTPMLAGIAEHSGIYVGNGEVVELQGNGDIKKVSVNEFTRTPFRCYPEFMEKISGAFPIYVSSHGKHAVGSKDISNLALNMVGDQRDYNLILDNCHQFCSGCITGNFENSDNFLWMLKHTAEKSIGATDWWLWDR